MVLFNFPSMSGATKSQEHPRPPSVQEIISDLQSAKVDDVAFKAPEGFLCLSREKETQGKTAEIPPKQAASRQRQREDPNPLEDTTPDAAVYKKAKEFLESYNSLAASMEKLKNVEDDLKSKEDRLTQSITKVQELWKVENTES